MPLWRIIAMAKRLRNEYLAPGETSMGFCHSTAKAMVERLAKRRVPARIVGYGGVRTWNHNWVRIREGHINITTPQVRFSRGRPPRSLNARYAEFRRTPEVLTIAEMSHLTLDLWEAHHEGAELAQQYLEGREAL